MRLMKSVFIHLAVILVLLSCFTDETEARRRVLRGRRVITHSYYEPSAIPGWGIIVIVAIVELLLGVGLFFTMQKFVIPPKEERLPTSPHRYVQAPVEDDV